MRADENHHIRQQGTAFVSRDQINVYQCERFDGSGVNDATGTREDTNADAHVPAARLGHISAPNAVNTTRYAMTTQHAMTSPRRMRMTRQCVRAIPSS